MNPRIKADKPMKAPKARPPMTTRLVVPVKSKLVENAIAQSRKVFESNMTGAVSISKLKLLLRPNMPTKMASDSIDAMIKTFKIFLNIINSPF
jgi:hypothetical protein